MKKNKKTVPLEQNRCGLNVLERALDYDDRSYDFDSLLSRYQLLRRWTAGRSVPAFFSPDLLSLKARRACNFLYDTVMSKLYRRKTNCKEPATGKKTTFIYATPNPCKIFSSAFIFSKTFTNHPRLTNLKQNGEIHDEYTNKIKLFARWIDLLESCFYQTLRTLSVSWSYMSRPYTVETDTGTSLFVILLFIVIILLRRKIGIFFCSSVLRRKLNFAGMFVI